MYGVDRRSILLHMNKTHNVVFPHLPLLYQPKQISIMTAIAGATNIIYLLCDVSRSLILSLSRFERCRNQIRSILRSKYNDVETHLLQVSSRVIETLTVNVREYRVITSRESESMKSAVSRADCSVLVCGNSGSK